jgi:acyl-CoA reductase-like NAD-dependent aldehyde dehydrogenase
MLLTGGVRDRACLTPTVLSTEPEVHYEETLAPMIVLSTVDSTRSAFATANAIGTGLPVGVLTHDLRTALLAARELDADVVVGALPVDTDALDDLTDIVTAYTRPQSFILSGGTTG